jgi:hypothetical protein
MGKIQSEEIKAEPDFYSIMDSVGREGIENYYEKTLRRDPGKIKIERDARGNVISKEVSSLPESGNNIVLWMDADLQKKIKEGDGEDKRGQPVDGPAFVPIPEEEPEEELSVSPAELTRAIGLNYSPDEFIFDEVQDRFGRWGTGTWRTYVKWKKLLAPNLLFLHCSLALRRDFLDLHDWQWSGFHVRWRLFRISIEE